LDTTILLFLLQDGITSGAIYALLGLALVLVFAVTRVILIPQGEFITFGALTYAMLSAGQMPGTALLALVLGAVAFAFDLVSARAALRARFALRSVAVNIALPLAIYAATAALAGRPNGVALNFLLAVVIVAPWPLSLPHSYQPIAHASVLVLLIASVACISRARTRTGVLRPRRAARAGMASAAFSLGRCASPARACV